MRDEFINVGVLTHIPQDKRCQFNKTKNISRILKFDDEIEPDMIKALLESVEYQFNTAASNLKGIEKKDFLKDELVYFVNQIQFSEVKALISENVEEDIRDLVDSYLYYDKKKSDRMDASKVKSLFAKIIKQNSLEKDLKSKPVEKNIFEQKPFDYSLNINHDRFLIKAVSFDYKKTNHLYKELKSLLYDLNYFKEKYQSNIKIIINNTEMNEEYEKTAYEILSKEADVYTLESFSDYLSNNVPKSHEQISLFDSNEYMS